MPSPPAGMSVPYTSQSLKQSIPSFTHRRNKSWREKWNHRHDGRWTFSRRLQQQSSATSLHTPIASASLLFAICGEPWQSGSTRCRCRGSPCQTSRFFSFPATGTFQFSGAGRYHGSCDDWLLLDHDNDGYLLVNPFSGDTVRLPSLNSVRYAFNDSVVLTWSGFITMEDE
ncbi:hypothetical protein PR202_ga22546 [Eleusine coracana subsp. coracana]|uniref:KIB1-4 beta-propeller domain-containing protein n=1 Tax=Eleusine coracana subsp. coracana TaxID=191504 RepID=A0AAV5D3D1_ELECO|nr:hypothetical protein PR202_ga22546 [Eleusine coracana subsp. coracana]